MSENYRHGPHTVFEIHLHLVWVTKYRKAVLTGPVGTRVRDLLREICARDDVLIIQGHGAKDHVHLFVSIPPQVTISRLVQRLKGKSAYKLLQEFPHLRKTFWGQHLWARGYCCCSSGNVTYEVIKAYIANQNQESNTTFPVDGGSPCSGGPVSFSPPVG